MSVSFSGYISNTYDVNKLLDNKHEADGVDGDVLLEYESRLCGSEREGAVADLRAWYAEVKDKSPELAAEIHKLLTDNGIPLDPNSGKKTAEETLANDVLGIGTDAYAKLSTEDKALLTSLAALKKAGVDDADLKKLWLAYTNLPPEDKSASRKNFRDNLAVLATLAETDQTNQIFTKTLPRLIAIDDPTFNIGTFLGSQHVEAKGTEDSFNTKLVAYGMTAFNETLAAEGGRLDAAVKLGCAFTGLSQDTFLSSTNFRAEYAKLPLADQQALGGPAGLEKICALIDKYNAGKATEAEKSALAEQLQSKPAQAMVYASTILEMDKKWEAEGVSAIDRKNRVQTMADEAKQALGPGYNLFFDDVLQPLFSRLDQQIQAERLAENRRAAAGLQSQHNTAAASLFASINTVSQAYQDALDNIKNIIREVERNSVRTTPERLAELRKELDGLDKAIIAMAAKGNKALSQKLAKALEQAFGLHKIVEQLNLNPTTPEPFSLTSTLLAESQVRALSAILVSAVNEQVIKVPELNTVVLLLHTPELSPEQTAGIDTLLTSAMQTNTRSADMLSVALDVAGITLSAFAARAKAAALLVAVRTLKSADHAAYDQVKAILSDATAAPDNQTLAAEHFVKTLSVRNDVRAIIVKAVTEALIQATAGQSSTATLAAVLMIAGIEKDPEILKAIIANKLAWAAIEKFAAAVREAMAKVTNDEKKVYKVQPVAELLEQLKSGKISIVEFMNKIIDILESNPSLLNSPALKNLLETLVKNLPDGQQKDRLLKLLGQQETRLA